MCPTNKEEWWKLLEDNWEDILNIFYRFLPMNECRDYSNNITTIPMHRIINRLKEDRNPDIARYLHGAWWSAPDNISIHKIPSWGRLCDLCSEEECLYPDGYPNEEEIV